MWQVARQCGSLPRLWLKRIPNVKRWQVARQCDLFPRLWLKWIWKCPIPMNDSTRKLDYSSLKNGFAQCAVYWLPIFMIWYNLITAEYWFEQNIWSGHLLQTLVEIWPKKDGFFTRCWDVPSKRAQQRCLLDLGVGRSGTPKMWCDCSVLQLRHITNLMW